VKLLNALAVTTEAMWVQKLKEVFDKNAGDHWCGFQTPVDLPNNKRFISTREMFKSHIEELAKSSLLRQVQDACGGRGRDRFFMSIFVVPKGLDSLRFIANCQFLNKFFDKPPKVVFADMDSLFRIFTFFGPRTFFAEADFRHWFYQIPLLGRMARFFNVRCGGATYEFRAWPMGFSWSPFVAQGLSMGIAKLGIERTKKYKAVGPSGFGPDLPPPG